MSRPPGDGVAASSSTAVGHMARPTLRPWWHGRLAFLKSVSWPGMASALVALALLLAFGQVVSKAVQVGESRQRAAAAHFDATWRCQALGSGALRRDCLTGLAATAPADKDGERPLKATSDP